MYADLAILKRQLDEATRNSPLAAALGNVLIEPDRDDEGTDFLRVTVQVRDAEDVSDEDFAGLLETIEGKVSDVDERYASVRFADAA